MEKYYKGINELENKINKQVSQGIMDDKAKREVLMKMALVEAAKEATKNPRINVMERANIIFNGYMKDADKIFEEKMQKDQKDPDEEIKKLREKLYQRQVINIHTPQRRSNVSKIEEVSRTLTQSARTTGKVDEKIDIEPKTEDRHEILKRKLAEAAKKQEELNKKIEEEQKQIDKKALIETIERKAEEARKARLQASKERRLKDEAASRARQEADLRASKIRQEADLRASKARQEADLMASIQRRIIDEEAHKIKAEKVEEKVEKLAKQNEQQTIDLNAKRSQINNQKMIDIYVSDQKKKDDEEKEFKVQTPFISTIRNAFNRMTSTLNPFRIKKANEAYAKNQEARDEFERAIIIERDRKRAEAEKEQMSQDRKGKQKEKFGSKFFQKINEKEAVKNAEKSKNQKEQEKEPDLRARWGM